MVSTSPISQQELKSGQFDGGIFTVTRYSGAGVPPSQYTHDYNLSKMDFFDLWIGQKLQPCSYGGNPPEPSGYTGLDSLASDGKTFLGKDQAYFQTDSGAKDFSAKVKGLAIKATSLGFPEPQGVLEQLADWVNGIISDVIGLVQSVWSDLTTFVGTFVVGLWDYILGSTLGPVIELVKSIVNIIIGQIVNILITPILSTDLLNRNPTTLRLLNSTEISKTKSEFSKYGTESFNSYSYNTRIFQENPVTPNLSLPFPINGALGELMQISGPMILQTVFQEIANIVLFKIFYGIFQLDTITLSTTDLNDLFTSFVGMSIDQLTNSLNIDINDVFNDPTIFISTFIPILSNINFSVFDYNNPSSEINLLGLGTITKGFMNCEELLISSISSILSLSTSNTDDLKSQINSEFFWFIGLDFTNQILDFVQDYIYGKIHDKNTPSEEIKGLLYARFFSEIWKSLNSINIFIFGNSIVNNVDKMKNGDILGQTSVVFGWEELVSEGLLFSAYLINIYSTKNSYYSLFGTASYLWKMSFSLYRLGISIFDVPEQSPFGSAYDGISILDAGLNFAKGLSDGINFEKDMFHIWKNIVEMIPDKLIRMIPIFLMFTDVGKFITGMSYLNSW